jgi:hypothetical protein
MFCGTVGFLYTLMSNTKKVTYPKAQAKTKPHVRSLKVQSKFRRNRYDNCYVPEIKLCGNWLEKFGFNAEDRVQITAMNRVIVITIEKGQFLIEGAMLDVAHN